MKKEFVILIAILLLTSFTLAANETITEKASDLKDKVSSTKIGEIGAGTKEAANNVLENELDIPDLIEIPARIIFGIEDGITIQHLIIVLGVWIGFFLLIFNLTTIIVETNQGVLKLLAAFIITSFISSTMILNKIAQLFLHLAGLFEWVNIWAPLKMILAIVLATAVIYISIKVANIRKREVKIEKAAEVGRGLREGFEDAKILHKESSYSLPSNI